MPILRECECLRCHWTWYPRRPGRPSTCPQCRCVRWDEPAKPKWGETPHVCYRESSDGTRHYVDGRIVAADGTVLRGPKQSEPRKRQNEVKP